MTDDMHLDRHEQQALCEVLEEVPGVVEDLAVTLTRQDVMGGGAKLHSNNSSQPLPYNVAASEASDLLRGELAMWARLVCEQRAYTYDGTDDTIGIARWLRRHIIALALTGGAHEAPERIRATVRRARAVCDRPRDARAQLDRDRIEEALGSELNASGIAAAAREIGPEYAGLSRSRVHGLARGGHLVAVRMWGDIPIYRLGDALDAHLRVPTRQRGKVVDTLSDRGLVR